MNVSHTKECFVGVDVLKFIAALIVVAIHTSVLADVFQNYGIALKAAGAVTSLAVPVFFYCFMFSLLLSR